jgi:tetratricopeptide (TPR) repeat protein
MPKSVNLTIVITSRNRDLGNLSTTVHLELGEMEEDEALATLVQAARRDSALSNEEMAGARTLIKELGYLALALVQAGTYCHQLSSYHGGILQPYTFTQYLSLFYSHRAELMKKAQPSPLDSYERGVYTTLDLSYQTLSQMHRDFLHFLSFFHHADIPLAVLATAARRRFEDIWQFLPHPEGHDRVVSALEKLLCVNGKWSDFQVQETISSLRSFSLISATSVGDSVFLHLHPLIQSWSRDMTQSHSHDSRAMVIRTLTSFGNAEDFPLYRHMLPHLLNILAQIKIQDLHVNDLAAAGNILRVQGHYHMASGLFEAALDKMSSCEEDATLNTLTVTAWLARSYRNEGRWTDAENLCLKVLEQRTMLLGMDHPDTITAATGLASTYWKQRRHSEAERLAVDVLERRRRVLGLEHPETIRATGDLALTYSSQGRHSEAEKLQGEVLERLRRVLGVEHPDTIRAARNLAAIYRKQGRYVEAVDLLAPAVKLSLKVLGQQHPSTQRRIKILAHLYEKLGKGEEAEETRKLLIS